MQKFIKVLLGIALFLQIIGCTGKVDIKSYSAPSDDQLNHFINEKSIEPLDIKKCENFSIVLFENGSMQGYYLMSVDKSGKIHTQYAGGIVDKATNTISTGGMTSGPTFLTVIINDSEIAKKASKLQVKLSDTSILSENLSTIGKIFVLPEKQQWIKIEVLDKKGLSLFKRER